MGGYIGAAVIAAIVAAIELVTRYRDDPWLAVRSGPSILYIIINAIIATGAAIWLVSFFPDAVSVTAAGKKLLNPVLVALIAGFGSLAVFRAGVMKVSVGKSEVSVGPGLIFEALLGVVDRGVDRGMAIYRGKIADALYNQLDFEKKGVRLVAECLGLLVNLSAKDGQDLRDVVASLTGRTDIDAAQKSRLLILTLLTVVGDTVLRQAVVSVNK